MHNHNGHIRQLLFAQECSKINYSCMHHLHSSMSVNYSVCECECVCVLCVPVLCVCVCVCVYYCTCLTDAESDRVTKPYWCSMKQ